MTQEARSDPELDAAREVAVRAFVASIAEKIATAAIAGPQNESVSELNKLKFNYAWNLFSFAADQRLKMFNYMLIAVGFLVNAAVVAVNAGLPLIGTAVCALSAGLLIIFALLDSRNQYLVNVSEDILCDLEDHVIFAEKAKFNNADNVEVLYRLLHRRKAGTDVPLLARLGKHQYWLRGIACLLAIAFIVAAFYFVANTDSIAARTPSDGKTINVRLVR